MLLLLTPLAHTYGDWLAVDSTGRTAIQMELKVGIILPLKQSHVADHFSDPKVELIPTEIEHARQCFGLPTCRYDSAQEQLGCGLP